MHLLIKETFNHGQDLSIWLLEPKLEPIKTGLVVLILFHLKVEASNK